MIINKHLTLSLSRTNPICPLKWERGTASSRLGEHTRGDSSICTPRQPSATHQGLLTNQQRIQMLFKRLYFPPRLSAGGASCGFIQPKMGISHVDRLSSEDAPAQPHPSQHSPLVLPLTKQRPGTSAQPRKHLTPFSKSPLRAQGKAGREQPPSRTASPGSGAAQQGSAMSAGTARLPPGERLPVACRWLL